MARKRDNMGRKRGNPVVLAALEERDISDGGRRLHMTPLRIDADGQLEVGERVVVDVRGSGDWAAAPHRRTAIEGNAFYSARLQPQGRKGRYLLERRTLFARGEVQTLSLGDVVPTAVIAHRGRCYIGATGSIHLADFASSMVKRVFTASDEGAGDKPIDAFAIAGSSLFAVDDLVWPKYLYVLELADDGGLEHRSTLDLPKGPNEEYLEAVAYPERLVLRSDFCHMGGSGNSLVFVSTRDEPKVVKELTEIRVEAFIGGDLGSTDQLLAGAVVTRWRAMAICGRHVLIAAEERGILSVPLNPRKTKLAKAHDVGGSCLDVVVRGGRVHALVTAGTSASTELFVFALIGKVGAVELEELARHSLAGSPQRLAR